VDQSIDKLAFFITDFFESNSSANIVKMNNTSF